MSVEIQEIGTKITGLAKKKPLLFWGGIGVVGLGSYILFRRNSSPDGLMYGYPGSYEQEGITGGDGGGGLDTGLQDLLDKAIAEQNAKFGEIGEQTARNQTAISQLIDGITALSSQQNQRVQAPIVDPVTQQTMGLMSQQEYTQFQNNISIIEASKALSYSPGASYTPSQVGVIANWVIEDNKARAGGSSIGTSKNPSGLASSGMTVTYKPDGTVQFNQSTSTATPIKTETRVIGGESYTVKEGTRSDWKPGQAY